MAELPDIDELTKGLDGSSRAVVVLLHGMLSSMMAQFQATTEKLEAENAELRGRRRAPRRRHAERQTPRRGARR